MRASDHPNAQLTARASDAFTDAGLTPKSVGYMRFANAASGWVIESGAR